MAMDRLFRLMVDKSASDLFVSVGSPINLKINGLSVPINQQIMTPDTILSLLGEILTAEQLDELKKNYELNVGLPIADVGSFRLSAFRQRGSFSFVIRYIPGTIPSFESLNLPPILKEIICEKRGLFLIVGSTGSGKSTTIASLLDYRNSIMSGHILTLEDPIEYLFRSKKSIVNQREIGNDAQSLNIALKNALRQAPDVILIGEIRDRETMTAAISYAQSGHLVVATLHANNSYHAMNRIVSLYPQELREALLFDLSASLRCVMSQRLVRAKRGGRIPAAEVLMNTKHVADLIAEGSMGDIKDAIEKSLAPGSLTFEQSLLDMILKGLVTRDDGLAYADSPNNLMWLLNNAEASGQTMAASAPAPIAAPEEKKPDSGASFTEFMLDV
ncbi:MAG: PilT/PilU family type 4a pilus ATPase [Burkholderiaceae bacterium]|nr:MAG: PilT/PilU family type 4a pilus ATPase [Burkholderiaceae bacterium]